MNLSRLVGASALGLVLVGTACSPKSKGVQPVTPTSAEMKRPSIKSETVVPSEIQPSKVVSETASAGTLPVGQTLTIRTVDAISSDSSRQGAKFAAVLATPVSGSNGKELLPAGTKVYGHVVDSRAGGSAKKPRISIALRELQGPKGPITIATDVSGAEGDRRGAVKKIGAGTVVGSASNGSDAAGAVAVVGGGKAIVIQAGTLVEFHLTETARLR